MNKKALNKFSHELYDIIYHFMLKEMKDVPVMVMDLTAKSYAKQIYAFLRELSEKYEGGNDK